MENRLLNRAFEGTHCRKAVGGFTVDRVNGHLMKPVNQESACRLEKIIFETNGDQKDERGYGMNSNLLILLVRPAGFEPAAYGFVVRRSIH